MALYLLTFALAFILNFIDFPIMDSKGWNFTLHCMFSAIIVPLSNYNQPTFCLKPAGKSLMLSTGPIIPLITQWLFCIMNTLTSAKFQMLDGCCQAHVSNLKSKKGVYEISGGKWRKGSNVEAGGQKQEGNGEMHWFPPLSTGLHLLMRWWN